MRQTDQRVHRGALLFMAMMAMLLYVASAGAIPLFWDAGNTNDGAIIEPGSGAWNTDTTTNLNWNNGSANVSWAQTSTTSGTMGAIFGGPDAAPGTYQVTMDGTQVAATNLQINNNGYTFAGSPIYINAGGALGILTVSNGVTVTFSNNLTGNNGNADIRLGSLGISGPPATVNLFGTMTSWQPTITSTNGSVFYLGGSGISSSGTAIFNADVRMTNGTYNSAGAFIIGRVRGAAGSTQPNNATGVFTLDGPSTILNQNSDYISIGRDSVWNSTLIIQNGATLNYQPGINNNNLGLGIPRPGSSGANNQSWVYVKGGTLNMGPGLESPQLARPIFIANGGSAVGENSMLIQSGGVINAWSGIQIGGTGTYNGGTGAYTNSGGFLYLGSIGGGGGIRYGASVPPTNRVSLSGGTMGALQNWISSVPMILDGINGNFTFQCSDANGNSFNIGLSGALTGPGGIYKTGPGILTLTGANNYAGSTVVSNGTLAISTASSPTNGAVVLDGTIAPGGQPLVSNFVASVGQTWTMTNLTFSSGTPTLFLEFGGLTPSTTAAPITDNGNLAFTVTPNIAVDGTALAVGDYPLIRYTGVLSGTPPTAPSQLPNNVTATIVNNTGSKTIVLHVTSGPTPTLTWRVGNGVWDINNTANWLQFGSSAKYQEGEPVQFDDSASGTSPITVTLNTTVNPSAVTAINQTKSFIITGSGSIAGSTGMSVSGAAGLTVTTTNTYTGGTTVTGPGLLNINYGGVGAADSAIGTGTLSLNTGAKLDNTSGHPVILNTATPIPINWNDDWTFVGSSPLDLGTGQVILGNVEVVLTVASNTLTVNNPITDNGNAYKLTKQGNGALTLSNANNNFSGGLDLETGTLNLNADSAGSGILNIGGGILDNTSGTDVALSTPSKLDLLASFTFNGTGNLNLGQAQTTIGGNPQVITLNGTGALETDGNFLGGNRATTVAGTGKWIIGGFGNNSGLGLTINGGTVYFNKTFGNAVSGGNSVTINTGGSLVMMSPTGTQFGATTPAILGGGTLDMNGDSETIASLAFNSGTLKNSADSTTSTLLTTASFTLGATNCFIGVDGTNGILEVLGTISGTGPLVKTGPGDLELATNETYTGSTVVSNGTLSLVGHGSIATSASLVLVSATSALDLSQSTDTNGDPLLLFTLAGGQSLVGNGTVLGSLTAPAGSTVAPGLPSSVGTLVVSNDANLNGTLLLNLNRTNSQTSSKVVSVTGSTSYSGTLNVTNVGPALQVNDTFQLFPAAVTTFGSINLATTDANGMTYVWSNRVAIDGSIKVLSVQASVNPAPPNILFKLTTTPNTLNLAWPTNLGWLLQAQTNAIGVGLQTNNWATVPGSGGVTNTNITINPANGSVFFRMVHP